MGEFKPYHIPKSWYRTAEYAVSGATDRDLERWSNDANCLDAQLCAAERASRAKLKEGTFAGMPEAITHVQSAFDPRREISADAQYIAGRIVTHLWVIFVLLPFVLGFLWYLLTH
jgi:hypothetical protein